MTLLDVDAVAARWGASSSTVYRLVKKGALKAVVIGPRKLRFRLVDVEAFEERGGIEKTDPPSLRAVGD